MRWRQGGLGPLKRGKNLLECVKMIAMLCQAGHCWILHLNEFKVVLMKAGEHGWDWTINLPSLHAFNGMVGRIPYFTCLPFSPFYFLTLVLILCMRFLVSCHVMNVLRIQFSKKWYFLNNIYQEVVKFKDIV